jgi:hypothetical protein
MSNIILIKEYKNADGIVISNDEITGNAYKNVTIHSDNLTPRLIDIKQKISNLCEDIFYKISINIGTFFLHDSDDNSVDENTKVTCLTIYSLIVNNIINNDILTETEVSDDVRDIQIISDKQFFENMLDLLIPFGEKLNNLTQQFHHA